MTSNQVASARRRFMGALAIVSSVLCATGAVWAEDLQIIAGPYLQYPTETTMTVRWETDGTASSEAGCGKAEKSLDWVSGKGETTFHEVVFEGLEPAGDYFYQVRSTGKGGGQVESEVYTFQTAVGAADPFSFVVLSDTQSTPEALSKLAGMAWAQRPHFTLLSGDLVNDGTQKEMWNEHFFRNTHALNSRVALIPCLGNHEKDTPFYYDYFSLPAPEYFYTFNYGNAAFFIVDSQRPLEPGSEQYEWLDKALAASQATWKIVCHHKPPYSSDEDDYGNTRKQRSFFGDVKLRTITPLYEKHKVDIVWSGHIHSYERTYPLVEGRPVQAGGVLYMVTGGGGGGLEQPGPWRSPFTAKVFAGHHYCLVNVFGGALRIEAYDVDGKLFDFVELRKTP